MIKPSGIKALVGGKAAPISTAGLEAAVKEHQAQAAKAADQDVKKAFIQDANDLRQVIAAIKSGDLKRANKIAYNVEGAVRKAIGAAAWARLGAA